MNLGDILAATRLLGAAKVESLTRLEVRFLSINADGQRTEHQIDQVWFDAERGYVYLVENQPKPRQVQDGEIK